MILLRFPWHFHHTVVRKVVQKLVQHVTSEIWDGGFMFVQRFPSSERRASFPERLSFSVWNFSFHYLRNDLRSRPRPLNISFFGLLSRNSFRQRFIGQPLWSFNFYPSPSAFHEFESYLFDLCLFQPLSLCHSDPSPFPHLTLPSVSLLRSSFTLSLSLSLSRARVRETPSSSSLRFSLSFLPRFSLNLSPLYSPSLLFNFIRDYFSVRTNKISHCYRHACATCFAQLNQATV